LFPACISAGRLHADFSAYFPADISADSSLKLRFLFVDRFAVQDILAAFSLQTRNSFYVILTDVSVNAHRGVMPTEILARSYSFGYLQDIIFQRLTNV
jgi:hypothetical protein